MKREVKAQESKLTAVMDEFRAPVRVLLGVARELKVTSPTTLRAKLSIVREISDTIEQQAMRLLALVDQLSVLTKENPLSAMDEMMPTAGLSTDFMQTFHDAIIATMSEGDCTVEGIAQLLMLSPSQLRRKLSSFTELSPKRYIMKVRMEVAHEMLQRNPDAKIASIAERCGFYDLSHFVRCYKDTYGITPAAGKLL